MDDSLRLHLLGIGCANQRLRAELAILKKCTKLQCRRCGTDITNTSELFSMSKTGPQVISSRAKVWTLRIDAPVESWDD